MELSRISQIAEEKGHIKELIHLCSYDTVECDEQCSGLCCLNNNYRMNENRNCPRIESPSIIIIHREAQFLWLFDTNRTIGSYSPAHQLVHNLLSDRLVGYNDNSLCIELPNQTIGHSY